MQGIKRRAVAIVSLADSFDDPSIDLVSVAASAILVDIDRATAEGSSVSTDEMVGEVNRACGFDLPCVGIQS